MLKIPFIDKTLVGVHIENNHLYWVQANKLVNRISVVAHGSIEIQESLECTLEQLKECINSEAYYLGITMPTFLGEVSVEEVSIPEEDTEEWIQNYGKNKTNENTNVETQVLSEFIELDEDLFRVFNLMFNLAEINEIQTIFECCDLYPTYVSSGLFESGYSQVLNPEFVDEFSSTISHHQEITYLVIFKKGRIHQIYNLEATKSLEVLLQQCDSLLKTEELSYELALHSIPLYVRNLSHHTSLNRELRDFTFSNLSKNKNNSNPNSVAFGTVMKLAFPELDSINLSQKKNLLVAQWDYARKELIRLSVLLFTPLIIFTLITYASNKIIETHLYELTQVHEQVSGNLALVELELKKVAELQNKFQTLSKDVRKKIYVTEIFEIIASIIPKDVWLTEFKASTENKRLEIELSGVSANASSISTFQRRCQNLEKTTSVQLLSSEMVSENGKLTSQMKFKISIKF